MSLFALRPQRVLLAGASTLKTTMGEGLKSILLVYASQTGNAEAIAQEIGEEMPEKCGVEARVLCADKVNKEFDLSAEASAIFVFSTTGDGDPPDNATKFWRTLKKKEGRPLAHLKYAILGLGDTNYSEFCGCPKGLDKKLTDLGAEPFYKMGLADDAVGLETVVEPWKDGLYALLAKFRKGEPIRSIRAGKAVPPPNGAPSDAKENVLPANPLHAADKKADAVASKQPVVALETTVAARQKPAKLSLGDTEISRIEKVLPAGAPRLPNSYLNITGYNDPAPGAETPTPGRVNTGGFDKSNPYLAEVTRLQPITSADAAKRTLLLELSLGDSGIVFEPGDAFGILPENCPEEVDALLRALRLTDVADKIPQLSVSGTGAKSAALPAHIRPGFTVRELFARCVDIRTLPKKTFLRALAEHCQDIHDTNTLLLLSSREGAPLYDAEIRDGWHRLLDLVEFFPSLNAPLSRLLELLPPLQPRYYSAASSPLSRPGAVRFAFNVVTFEGYDSPMDKGVCTGWLDRLETQLAAGAHVRIPIFVKPTPHFRLPADLDAPVVMIGPGTGVAPFVGFVEHRRELRKKLAHGSENGPYPVEEMSALTLEHSQLHQLSQRQLGDPQNMQPDLSMPGPGPGLTNDEPLSWLFFGCRHESKDFLFREELEDMLRAGALSQLSVCFSRDDAAKYGVRYVQDNVRLHGRRLASLMRRGNAHIYVCGDAKNMAKDVDRALVDVLVEHQGIDAAEAEKLLHQWHAERRYLKDVWA